MFRQLKTLSLLVAASEMLGHPAAGQVTGRNIPDFQRPWEKPLSFFEPPQKAFAEHLKYGKKNWQRIELFPVRKGSPVPLVIAIGGISDWARYRVNEAGYAIAFVTIPPDPTVKAAARLDNLLDAIAYLLEHSAELNIDMNRLAVHGGGVTANQAFLLGTDPSLLERAGVPFTSLRAVTTVNGSGYDIPKRISESSFRKQKYERDYGKDLVEQLRLSPVTHLAAPNAPRFLMFITEDSTDIRPETEDMVAAAVKAGIDLRLVELPEKLDDSRKTYFLAEPDGSGKEYIPFLRDQFGD